MVNLKPVLSLLTETMSTQRPSRHALAAIKELLIANLKLPTQKASGPWLLPNGCLLTLPCG